MNKTLSFSLLTIIPLYLFSTIGLAQPNSDSQTSEKPTSPANLPKTRLSRDVQIGVDVYQLPSPFIADDKKFLVYEIFLTNFNKKPMVLVGLDVNNPASQTNIAHFDETALAKMTGATGVKYSYDGTNLLLPGMRKVLYMWLPFEVDARIPSAIKHKLIFQTVNDTKGTTALYSKTLPIDSTPPLIVGSPLRGDFWVAGNGPSNTSDHRRAYRLGDGRVHFSQRFAIDFVQIGGDGLTYKGDKTKNSSYYAYKANVYSVAPGEVVEVTNNIPENTPHGKKAVKIDLRTIGGNYVLVNIGNDRYAYYAHLLPGSITVKPGDKVVRGQVIGQLGNSGNSSEPHLHFHIASGPDPIYANGIPYAFEAYSMRSTELVEGKEIQIKLLNDELTDYENESVLENTVLKFPDDQIKSEDDQATQDMQKTAEVNTENKANEDNAEE